MGSLTVSSSDRVKTRSLQSRTLPVQKLNPLSRWLVMLATLILPVAYFMPIWRIQLWAPQYPEGLEMKIWINKLTGSIDIINGLNHYIGMANIEEDMFPELKFLVYILAGMIALGFVTFIVNKPVMLKIFTATILIFAVAAMVDMFMWGYKYGHNLDPHAAIKIEGESYQPPLIGYKQLLNFLALSVPDKGGMALFGAGLLAIIASLVQWFKNRKLKSKMGAAVAVLVISFSLFSCNSAPEKLNYNMDACDHCGMKLVDNRYGAMIVTGKGKAFRFDDLNCMVNYLNENVKEAEVGKLLITDFSSPGTLIDATKAHYLKNEELKSPMGANAAAFEKSDSLEKYFAALSGEKVHWADVKTSTE